VATTTEGGPHDEVQRVGHTGEVYAGTFTLTYSGQTTAAIVFNRPVPKQDRGRELPEWHTRIGHMWPVRRRDVGEGRPARVAVLWIARRLPTRRGGFGMECHRAD